MQPLIELSKVIKEFSSGEAKTTALSDATLSINRGEFVAIVGPSGSGKSTMMNLIGCLDVPTSGTVKIAGFDLSELDDEELTSLRAQTIGFVFQQFQLLPRLSAVENVMAPLLYQGVSQRQARIRAAKVLGDLGLGERLEFDRTKLSGGQQQRVAIARALVTDPAILLADEPTGALDSESGKAVMGILRSLHEEGKTIVLITHDSEVASQAQRRIQIRDGKLVRDERSAA
jgi:ABC-type lipoprotein export system ATPase subunit